MAWRCGNCGAETSRGKVTFDEKGRMVRERCKYCAPEEFAEAFRAPSDQKIYAGPDAMPNMYTRDSEGVYHAKDELIADTAANWENGPTERARAHKAATRRTEPLTPAEIEATRRWGEEVLGPALRKGGMGAVMATLNPR
jgi:hypothetical protein